MHFCGDHETTGKLSIHFCGDHETAEAVFRTVISVNQLLSIHGAAADMCEELALSSSQYGETRC